MNMNKKTIITILLALVTFAGQAQVPLESVKESHCVRAVIVTADLVSS